MIRVLHVIDSLDLGGAQTVLVNLARFRDRSAVEMEVAPMHGRGVFADALEKETVRVHFLSGRRFPPGYLFSLPRLLRRGRYDVVHFHLFGSNWIGKPLAALCGQRLLVNHDHCNDRTRTGSIFATWVDTATNRLSSHIYAVSRSTRDDVIARENVDPERISFLANGVDTQRFSPPGGEGRQSARRKLGLPADSLVVAGLGRLHPQKNWPLFLEVAGRFPAVDFVVAGTGPEEMKVRRLAPRNVRLLGFRDAREVLSAADVFMLTSDYEGTPMILLEAMSSGLACVVSAVDGCLEVLGDGAGGATARPGDVEDFVQKLEPYIDSAELRRQQGETARAKVLSSFDARHQVREIEALYARLLAGV
ncbi:MAG: glycosyltransferase [Chthoniobacterales bacterium]|jgi:glycosyltransferase involved in cell wall biosynthesis